jgi:hypothetical protein
MVYNFVPSAPHDMHSDSQVGLYTVLVLQIPICEVRSDGRDNFLGALILAGLYNIPEVSYGRAVALHNVQIIVFGKSFIIETKMNSIL